MLRVSDLMTHSVVTLTPHMSLAQAATTLATLGVSGAPVCDAGGGMVGVFSKSDVVRLDGSIPPSRGQNRPRARRTMEMSADQVDGGFDPKTRETAGRVLQACESRGFPLVTAESLTGGLIAATLSSIPGASHVLVGGFITYSVEMKAVALGVDRAVIEAHGVVSEEVARAMAHGALAHGTTFAMIAIAVTGVAGPGPDADGTPAGTVHIACAVRGGPDLHCACAFGDVGREVVRSRTVQRALDLAMQALEPPGRDPQHE